MGTALAALRYTRPQIAVHWLSSLLVIAAYATRELAEELSGTWSRELVEGLHYGVGLSLLLLTALRLVLRWLLGAPRHAVVPPALQRWLAAWCTWRCTCGCSSCR